MCPGACWPGSARSAGVLTQQKAGAAAAWAGPAPGEPAPSLQPGSDLSLLKCGEANIIAPEMGKRDINTKENRMNITELKRKKKKISISYNNQLRGEKSVGKMTSVHMRQTEMVSDTITLLTQLNVHRIVLAKWKMDKLRTLTQTTEDKQNTME